MRWLVGWSTNVFDEEMYKWVIQLSRLVKIWQLATKQLLFGKLPTTHKSHEQDKGRGEFNLSASTWTCNRRQSSYKTAISHDNRWHNSPVRLLPGKRWPVINIRTSSQPAALIESGFLRDKAQAKTSSGHSTATSLTVAGCEYEFAVHHTTATSSSRPSLWNNRWTGQRSVRPSGTTDLLSPTHPQPNVGRQFRQRRKQRVRQSPDSAPVVEGYLKINYLDFYCTKYLHNAFLFLSDC